MDSIYGIEISQNELWGMNIDQVVDILLEYKDRGIKAYCNFNGHMLYSDTVTLDSAYLEILGGTKEEFERFLEKNKVFTKTRNNG